MGVTKKAKITFTCEPDLKDVLEEWARSESRTLSNLIEMVVRQAYETYQKRPYSAITPTPEAATTKGSRIRTKKPTPIAATAKTKRGGGTAQQQNGDSNG